MPAELVQDDIKRIIRRDDRQIAALQFVHLQQGDRFTVYQCRPQIIPRHHAHVMVLFINDDEVAGRRLLTELQQPLGRVVRMHHRRPIKRHVADRQAPQDGQIAHGSDTDSPASKLQGVDALPRYELRNDGADDCGQHQRQDDLIATRDLVDDEDGRERGVRRGRHHCRHAHQRIVLGTGGVAPSQRVNRDAERTPDASPQHQRRCKHSAGASGADRQARRHHLQSAQHDQRHQQTPVRTVAVVLRAQQALDDRVSVAEERRHVLLGFHEQDVADTDRPQQRRPGDGLEDRVQIDPGVSVLGPIQRLDKHHRR